MVLLSFSVFSFLLLVCWIWKQILLKLFLVLEEGDIFALFFLYLHLRNDYVEQVILVFLLAKVGSVYVVLANELGNIKNSLRKEYIE